MTRTDDALARIGRWLSDHAPALGDPFGPPADPAVIAEAEGALSAPLPPDYRAFVEKHDGQRFEPASGTLAPFVRNLEILPLRHALGEHRAMVDEWGDEGPGEIVARGPVRPLYKSARWLPIACLFGSSQLHCLDLDPAEGGRPGQVIWMADDDEQRRVVAPDFAAYLALVADALAAPGAVVTDEGIELPDDVFDRLLDRAVPK